MTNIKTFIVNFFLIYFIRICVRLQKMAQPELREWRLREKSSKVGCQKCEGGKDGIRTESTI